MDKLQSIYELRNLLRQVEREAGLSNLARVERDVLLAARSLCLAKEKILVKDCIQNHPLLERVAPEVVQQAITRLFGLGLLVPADKGYPGSYVVQWELVESLPRLG
ncbi:hypothetical protein [Maritimibacter sp. DP1N21-5]|uniref:hypothetical protein n=1 Tax=Maritimibacter sp. DP1N21-5 TaxID=2836867 RepID=UPI001C46AA1C|nr:hypothetical protein [Maritimibacter sp. DP1N21-5]MBV7408217.1 hypothetical protein [Maritimibacter sp. DP1N21-5]